MQKNLQEYCKECAMEYLLSQWDQEKNVDLTPASVSYGSNKKVWWQCEKGHEWQAVVKSRTSGYGCPVCAGKAVAPGETDLAATHPELARQWHPVLNGELTAQMVTSGSERKVWWRCEKGHEWQAAIFSRTGSGVGCPVCAGKVVVPGENDLASAFPEIAREWHPTKNGELSPDQVTLYSNRRVWWQCKLGHEWQTSVAGRTKAGNGCAYCSGRRVLAGFNDLQTVMPELAEQWHPALNGELTPQMVGLGSHKKVWWECSAGHVWKSVVYARTSRKKTGCPVCAGKRREDWQQRYAQAQAAGQQKGVPAGFDKAD